MEKYPPKEQHTRFLYPFWLEQDSVDTALAALQTLSFSTRNNDMQVWERVEKPSGIYQEEMLDRVTQFLFSGEVGSCGYLQVNKEVANKWFDKQVSELSGGADSLIAQLKMTDKSGGIELFLSHFGVGILAISLTATNFENYNLAKQFNYRLSQGRKRLVLQLALPHSHDDPRQPPPPAASEPLTARLGKCGGKFDLVELRQFLLSPLEEEKLLLPPLQTQFSVYTVVHFDNPVDFSQAEIREQLQPLLAALTHVEEPNHPGSLELVHKVMNPCHWAAVGTLGMAQLTAEQSPKQKFDRVSVVLNKYFMAYLSAYLQRLVLQRILNEASIVVRQKGTVENQAELQQLHSATLDFTITGYFTEISSREVLNQTYRLVQQGLRVPESFAMVQNTLHRIDVNKNARFQKEMSQDLNTMAKELNHNVDAVTGMHHKMEWLEVFFVSFYAMQLSQILSKSFHFVEVYSSWSVVSWPFVAGFMAFLGLQPHKRKRDKESKFDIYGPFLLLVIMVMIWFVVGYSFFRG
jgi:hypothetical protein